MRLIVELRDAKGIMAFWQTFDDRVSRHLQAIGMLAASTLTRQLQRVAPRRTGAGARSIVALPSTGQRITRGWLWEFFAKPHMLFTVPPGTRPHEIRARRARALRFYWEKGPRGPGIYFFKRVMHPGYRPPFDWRSVAIERTRHQLAPLLREQMQTLLRS